MIKLLLVSLALAGSAKADETLLLLALGETHRPKSMPGPLLCHIKESALTITERERFKEAAHKSQKAKYMAAFHMKAEIPSLHIWMYFPEAQGETLKKTLLFQDGDSIKKKTGKEAEWLVAMAREKCLPLLSAEPASTDPKQDVKSP